MMSDIDSARLHLDALDALEEADLALFRAENLDIAEAHRLDDVTRAWVEALFQRDAPGAKLLAFERIGGHSGMTDRGRWSLAWNRAGEAANLPTGLFAKATPTRAYNRETLALLHMGYTEVRFYQQIQPEIPRVAPRAYHGAAFPGGRYILLLEDMETVGLVPYRMADKCSLDHARAVAEAMAEYHARYWNSPRFDNELSWARPRSRRYGRNWHAKGMRRARVAFLDTEFAKDMPDPVRALLHRYNETFLDLYEYWDSLAPTIVHGDSHLGNSFSTREGKAGMFDWQLVFRGSGFRDFSYFLYSALDNRSRETHERELFDHYVDALQDRGVKLDRATAWNDYCLLILERWDSLLKSTTHGMFGHDPSAYHRQAATLTAGLVEHDVAGLLEHAMRGRG
jgi:hypothetical protein